MRDKNGRFLPGISGNPGGLMYGSCAAREIVRCQDSWAGPPIRVRDALSCCYPLSRCSRYVN
jgi:hypothetical protein